MEPLISYINEAIEINKNEYYRTVTLLRHENIDCPNLTVDEFVEMMHQDLEKALDEYKNAIHGEIKQDHKSYVEYRTKEAEEFAAKKWKTDKRRQEYVKRAIFNAENDTWRLREAGIFFDFRPDIDVASPQVCTISPSSSDKDLALCFKEVSKSKWWQKATGWVFKYECDKKTLRYSFRPRIDLIMDESSTAERKREKEALDNAISAWYGGSAGHWTGD